jgi:hypothetical protein
LPLNDKQWELVNFTEQEYLSHGSIPTADRISSLGLAEPDYWRKFLSNQDVRNSLLARGIPLSHLGGGNKGVLTEEQLTAANTMLDLRDNRSQKKKLADLGVPTQKWEAWLRDPGFSNYLRARAEGILGDNQHEAATALLDRVRSGDTNAIKFYYEITGRHVQNRNDSVNVPALLMRVMEIIQKHVDDAEKMSAIADEFLTLASGVGIGLASERPPVGIGSSERVIDL